MAYRQDKESKAWLGALVANGHTPVMTEEGYLDVWVMNVGFHNGPGCSKCGMSWCEHCDGPEVVGHCKG